MVKVDHFLAKEGITCRRSEALHEVESHSIGIEVGEVGKQLQGGEILEMLEGQAPSPGRQKRLASPTTSSAWWLRIGGASMRPGRAYLDVA